jgi:hypothetical protein
MLAVEAAKRFHLALAEPGEQGHEENDRGGGKMGFASAQRPAPV